jgi:predicted nucleic acid-binding protein
MSYLVDSNVLLRLTHQRDSMHENAQSAYKMLREQDQVLYVVPQNLIEFWAVATRPTSANGLGLTVEEAAHESSLLKQLFCMKPDVPEIYTIWEQLVIKYQVCGKQAHDTRLVAAVIAHQITHLLTFNTSDFNRFDEITCVDPRNLLSPN